MNSLHFEINAPIPEGVYRILVHGQGKLVNKDIVASFNAFDETGTPSQESIGDATWSKALNSWFYYMPTVDSQRVVDLGSFTAQEPIQRMNLKFLPWKSPEIFPSNHVLAAFLASDTEQFSTLQFFSMLTFKKVTHDGTP